MFELIVARLSSLQAEEEANEGLSMLTACPGFSVGVLRTLVL